MAVELIRIGDDVSVRLDGREIHLLPKRSQCTFEDLRSAFQALEKAMGDKVQQEAEALVAAGMEFEHEEEQW